MYIWFLYSNKEPLTWKTCEQFLLRFKQILVESLSTPQKIDLSVSPPHL